MKRFFSWLLKPWVLSLLGVILLSLILWFEGPLLAFNGSEPFASENVRWTFIFIFFAIWAIYFLWKFVAARIANARLMKSVAGEDQPAPVPVPGAKETAAELDALSKRLQEAMNVLKKAKLGGKQGGLYQLPWYMFVGAPGTGKTTALVQSGLKFPLADSMGKAAIGGVGGTRNCDWWFTDEAVLLDTAGRYTTQDSYTEVDKAAWGGFLQLLRKHRRRRPVNGVIIALSVADLLQQNEGARQAQAQAIRERIKELHERLGIRFPIYVMVTKCDLLAGFVEFFDNLGREERAQVWGMTFPLADANQVDSALAAFPEEFQLLEQQLQARVLHRMQQERDTHRRALIYSFPQQFAGVGEVLGRFLNDVFQSSRYEEKALLRGVYFSSGTQEGSPIDRVMGAMAAAFGLDRQVLPPNAASGRSYFITSLLRDVIFPEANLAGVNLGLERKRRWLQWGASIAIAVLFLLLSAGLLTSYFRNQAYVAEVDQKVGEINKLAAALPAQGSELQTLPLLNAIRALPGGYAEREQGAPLLMRFGLYQGDKLGAGAQAVYQKMLRETLLPRLINRMEQQLRRDSANNNDYLYETLRVYLMLGDAKHFDAASVGVWLDYYWSRNLKDAGDEQKQALSEHVQALLEQFNQGADEPPKLDTTLISDTRLTLARMPIQQRVYNRLKRELSRSKLPEFSVTNVGGRDAPQVFVRRSGEPLTRGINGMFSVAGYGKFTEQNEQAIIDVAKDSWVLAQQEQVASLGSTEQIKAAVLQLYFNDYIAQWDGLLADVGIAPFSTLDQGARVTNILSGGESPLRKFLLAAAKETTLQGIKPGKLGTVSDAVKGKLDSYKKKLESAIGSGADDAPAPVKALNPVDAHFDDLHKMAGAGGAGGAAAAAPGAAVPLDAVLAMLKDVAVYLDAAGAAKRTGTPPPAGEALSKLKREADGKPAPLAAMLKNIDSSGAGLTSGSERERLNSLWVGSGGQFCRDAIAGRYPLVRSAAKEVTADDFGKFFAPGGLADDFFQKNLLQYVDMGGGQWRWRSTANNASLGIPQEVLNEFQRAAKIRDAFFGAGGRQASMRFDLKPVNVDAGLSKLLLEIDGQQLAYAPNAALRPTSFQLPSGKGSGQVRFETAPAARAELRTDGNWAWFHMLDKGVLEPTTQGERYKLSFDFDGKKAVFELTASSVINPFRRDMLEQFHCMDKL
ncbi:MAG: type VI secretion system membrane subunit TssM [Pseudomonadota bacterium]